MPAFAIRFGLALLLGALCVFMPVRGQAALKDGDAFPDISLAGDLSEADQAYLGVSRVAPPYLLSRLSGRAFLVEMFSMYCPYCQREAQPLAEMFKNLQASRHKDQFKMIGIGVNNTAFEVGLFKKKFPTPFPLFADPDGVILAKLDVTATPTFYVIKRAESGGLTVVKTHIGHIEDPGAFLQEAFAAAGLK